MDERRKRTVNTVESPSRSADPIVSSTIEEVENYSSSVAGIELEAVRAGASTGLTEVTAVVDDRYTFTSSKVGFPMLSRTTLRDDVVCVAYMQRTIVGSRWCEMNLQPGAVIAHAPSSEHTARNLPGTQFMFVIADRVQFELHADRLGIRFDPPPTGEVHLLVPSAKTCLVGQTLETFAHHVASAQRPPPLIADAVMSAITMALSEPDREQRIGTSRGIDSRHIVHTCIDYATSIHRIPSVSELCLAAHVSERTLRDAFCREYGLPPSQYFRAWALDQAHRRLGHHEDNGETVTEVASGLGLHHLGRFAGQYKKVYGEAPSATLRPAS
jgi:AraC family ethanolamine operon transcriptional activator